jgi:glycerophosphoryl diester phosphodiesterase
VSCWAASPLVVGHRGGRGDGWPVENTLLAFDQARAQGARAVELDVRTCAGGQVVVFHDATLERLTHAGDVRPVHGVDLARLRGVDLGGGARIPELIEVLAWAREHGVGVNVEMKHDVPSRPSLARATVQVVRASGADVLLSSFDPLLLAVAAATDPGIPRALLAHEGQSLWADALRDSVRPPWASALHLERTQVGASVARYLRRGLRVGAWTVNDPDEARRLVGLGVASIITDRPGEMCSALTRT